MGMGGDTMPMLVNHYPSKHLLFKVNKRNIRKRYDIYSKLTMKKPNRRQNGHQNEHHNGLDTRTTNRLGIIIARNHRKVPEF